MNAQEGWGTTDPFCNWWGIKCVNNTIVLDLRGDGLTGMYYIFYRFISNKTKCIDINFKALFRTLWES